jgi:hypothetical protein
MNKLKRFVQAWVFTNLALGEHCERLKGREPLETDLHHLYQEYRKDLTKMW